MTPPAEPPDTPSTHLAPPTYRPPGLIPPNGPARTWGLAVIVTPLLLVLMLALFGGLAGGSAPAGPSDSPGSSGSGFLGAGSPGTAGRPTYDGSTTAPASQYGDTSTPDVYGTPETATTDGYGDGGYASATDTGGGTPSASASGGPSEVVAAYFEAINARDYRSAWALGGKNLDSSYSSFASGYASTERDTIHVVSVTGAEVRLTIEALQTDGTTHSYDATYTVSGGVITSGKGTQTG
ncbi:hypothetical protein VT52_011740 [Streptomyces malaysiense]|uniref:Uncharacterized protein n=1 Tax=Streptomyces malaysiense TaxID=1428626 RepID=A0A1J4Q2U5_9ACTN|nr:hypothetical protein VT52_011740 [Streptomyces malaysiense]